MTAMRLIVKNAQTSFTQQPGRSLTMSRILRRTGLAKAWKTASICNP